MAHFVRRVVVVFGEFSEHGDFVIEPSCSDTCQCEFCKDSIWIQEVKK